MIDERYGYIHSNKVFLTPSIANQPIKGLGQLVLLEIITKLMHTRERVQLAFHNVKVIHVEAIDLGYRLHLIDIPDGTDHVILVGGEEILYGLATESGRAACDDYQLCG